jgi:beta-phosphoglucomutase
MEKVKRKTTLIQGVAFDLEGTIIDVESLHHIAHLRAAADIGINLSWQEAVERLPHFVGGPDEEVATEITLLAKNEKSPEKVLLAKRAYFSELLHNKTDIAPRKGFREFLNWVKSLGISTAIGTVSEHNLVLYLLKQAGLETEFSPQVIVAKEDVTNPKPSPDVYYETARRMDINPKNQLVFEDSIIGLSSARLAGCRLAAIPTLQLPDFVQLLYRAGAEAVFMSWEDNNIKSFIHSSLK